jgi:transposase
MSGRKPLPAHPPRERVLHEPAAACACCGGKVLRRIGDDVTEVLEYVPSSFTVMQHVRPKLSCRACETIVQAPPRATLPGGNWRGSIEAKRYPAGSAGR